MSEHQVTTDSGTLVYQRLGDGAPRIVLLPGWGINAHFLRTTAIWPALETWAARHPLLIVDRRGSGGSRTNAGPHSPEQIAADLVAVLDDAKIERAVVWAHADAVLSVLPVASQQPDRVAALVLQAPFARLLAGPDMPAGMEPRMMLALAMLIPSAPVVSELDALGLGDGASGDGVTRLRDTLAAGMLPSSMNEVAQIDARPLLPSVRAPALVLHGSDDRVIPLEAGEAFAGMLARATFERIEGMGHLPSLKQFTRLLNLIGAFLEEAESGP